MPKRAITYQSRQDIEKMPFEVIPLCDSFAVEIGGLRLSDSTPEEVIQSILDVLAVESVITFRNQDMTADDQVSVCGRFGEPPAIQKHAWAPNVDADALPGKPTQWGAKSGKYPLLNRGDLIYFVNGPDLCEKDVDTVSVWDEEEAHDKGLGHACWHTGDTEKMSCELTSMLYAELAPTEGGRTRYCDMVVAYERLPEAFKKRLDGLRVIHYFSYPRRSPPVSQPLVKTHPATGRKHLFMNYNTMERIEGMEREESDEFLKELFYLVFNEESSVYLHEWSNGDAIVWNNNPTMHKRGPLISGVQRILRRTQMRIPSLQSREPWDLTREVADHDGGDWFPYPFDKNG